MTERVAPLARMLFDSTMVLPEQGILQHGQVARRNLPPAQSQKV
jgi:hypothetical protein